MDATGILGSSHTPAQIEAIRSNDSEILAIAGAGAGKTRVLIERIHRLITECGAAPSQFLVLTFTRKAAGEMLTRLKLSLAPEWGDSTASRLATMSIGTFHSVAWQWVRQHRRHIGYGENINVITPEDSELVLEQCSRDLGLDRKVSMTLLQQLLQRIYSGEGISIEQDESSKIIREYWSRLRSYNCLDYGQILMEAGRLLDIPEVRQQIAASYRYVLVDEAHDCDQLQHLLHHKISAAIQYFGIYDPRQSIYAFRGARPDLVPTMHPDACVIQMNENFRCADAIINHANRLIAHNEQLFTAPMVGKTGRLGMVRAFNGRTADIVHEISKTADSGMPFSSIAVLARHHKALRRIANVMLDVGIPHHLVGSTFDICDDDLFKAALAMLRLLHNHRDNIAFLRLQSANADIRRCYHEIVNRATHDRISHYAAARQMIPSLPAWEADMSLAAALLATQQVLDCPRVIEWWRKQISPSTSLASALRWLSFRDAQDDVRTGQHVTLMTAHAAKGLEWPCCFVVGLNEQEWPTSQAIAGKVIVGDGIDEERRLAYVAMTRAMQELHLHYRLPEDQHLGEGKRRRKPNEISRFLHESGVL